MCTPLAGKHFFVLCFLFVVVCFVSEDVSFTELSTLTKSPRANLHVVGLLRFMSDINQPSLPTAFFFILFSCLFLSLWSFRLYFIPQILPTTLRFLTVFFRSYLGLIGPFNCISCLLYTSDAADE